MILQGKYYCYRYFPIEELRFTLLAYMPDDNLESKSSYLAPESGLLNTICTSSMGLNDTLSGTKFEKIHIFWFIVNTLW